MTATINEEAASAVSSDLLRKARLALREAIADGEEHLRPILDEVEAALIEQIARARREVKR